MQVTRTEKMIKDVIRHSRNSKIKKYMENSEDDMHANILALKGGQQEMKSLEMS